MAHTAFAPYPPTGYPERTFFGFDVAELDAYETGDEEVKDEKKTEKKRIEVIWNELKFEFVWRVGTPTHLLVFRLARMLDPLADGSRLMLTDGDGLHVELGDGLESGVSYHAKFVDGPLPPFAIPQPNSLLSSSQNLLPPPGYQPQPSPVLHTTPIVASNSGGQGSPHGVGGGFPTNTELDQPRPRASKQGPSQFIQSLKRKRGGGAPSVPTPTVPVAPMSSDDEIARFQREGFLLLRKVVRKAIRSSRYLNGTGIYGVYPQLHHHKTYSAWKDHPRCQDIYKVMRGETDRLAYHPEVLTVMQQFGFQHDVLNHVVETYFRSNRGLCKNDTPAKPPRFDPAAELDTAVGAMLLQGSLHGGSDDGSQSQQQVHHPQSQHGDGSHMDVTAVIGHELVSGGDDGLHHMTVDGDTHANDDDTESADEQHGVALDVTSVDEGGHSGRPAKRVTQPSSQHHGSSSTATLPNRITASLGYTMNHHSVSSVLAGNDANSWQFASPHTGSVLPYGPDGVLADYGSAHEHHTIDGLAPPPTTTNPALDHRLGSIPQERSTIV